jgi:hypothetical protein
MFKKFAYRVRLFTLKKKPEDCFPPGSFRQPSLHWQGEKYSVIP